MRLVVSDRGPLLHRVQDSAKEIIIRMSSSFLDLVKTAYPNGAPFAKFILSIQTLMGEIRNYSRNF